MMNVESSIEVKLDKPAVTIRIDHLVCFCEACAEKAPAQRVAWDRVFVDCAKGVRSEEFLGPLARELHETRALAEITMRALVNLARVCAVCGSSPPLRRKIDSPDAYDEGWRFVQPPLAGAPVWKCKVCP